MRDYCQTECETLSFLLLWSNILFHKFPYFRRPIEHFSIDFIISNQFLLPISRQSPFCYVHHLAEVVIVEQRIAIEAIALSSHAVKRILNLRQSFNDGFEHFAGRGKVFGHPLLLLCCKGQNRRTSKQE